MATGNPRGRPRKGAMAPAVEAVMDAAEKPAPAGDRRKVRCLWDHVFTGLELPEQRMIELGEIASLPDDVAAALVEAGSAAYV